MISIIVGTNRPNSFSRVFAQYYHELLTSRGIVSNILDLHDLPDDFTTSALYEKSGKNGQFNKLQELIEQSQKLVFVVPEYNGSFPGVLKAFIDGLKYPHSFSGKKCALVGLSSGGQGGGLALSHLTDILNYMGMHVLALKPKLSRIEENWGDNLLRNNQYQRVIERQIDQLLEF
ncbi:MAG: NAD(P)H-dependent oxidoreductase [Bacteroidota bacterium]|nr:NAD(P)H-dependent oxidoreductase [Bacteroidota bacterium]